LYGKQRNGAGFGNLEGYGLEAHIEGNAVDQSAGRIRMARNPREASQLESEVSGTIANLEDIDPGTVAKIEAHDSISGSIIITIVTGSGQHDPPRLR
jgi:hypothetical protein